MRFNAVLCFLLATQQQDIIEAFNTPRLVAKSSTASSVGSSSLETLAPLTATQRCRNNELLCLRATSDSETEDGNDDGEEEQKEDELDTESTTTGLFIPGFSDKVAPPPKEETKKPKPDTPPPVVKKEEPKAVVTTPPPKAVVASSTRPISKSPTIRLPNFGKSEPPPQALEPIPPSQPKAKVVETKKEESSFGFSLPSLPSFGDSKPKPPPPPKRSKVEETIAAAVGGTITGAVVGLYADVATDVLMDTDLPTIVPPVALGVAFGAGAYVGANQDNFLGTITKFIFGGPIVSVKDSITNKITQTVDNIVSTPGRIKDAAIKKVDDTVDEIKATPGKIADAAKSKVDDTVEEIKATPGKIADAAKNKVDDTVEEIKATPGKIADATMKVVDETVEEIKATPGRIAESVEDAIEDAVEDVVEAVEEAVAVPAKKLNELSEKLGVGVLAKQEPPKVPEPPKPPLQAPKKEEPKSFFPSADVKLEVPNFSFPKPAEKKVVTPTTPPPPKPVDLPKFDLPKIDLPSVPSIEKPKVLSSAPKPAPPAKKKKNDPYVFTETALKDFILKDKPAVTELDKQQEEERKAKQARDAAISTAAGALFPPKEDAKVKDIPVVAEKKPTLRIKGISPPLNVRDIQQKSQPKAKKAAKSAAKVKTTPVKVPPVKGRPTFSLFGIGGGVTPEAKSAPTVTKSAPKAKTPTLKIAKSVSAPRGVPTISKWKLNPDKSISGFISGSSAFKEGEPVTTSAIVGNAADNTVVRTKSGSQYFLGEEDTSSGGLFGLFGSASNSAPSSKPAAPVTPKGPSPAEIAAERRQQAAEKQRLAKEAAAAAAEERKQAQAAAAAERARAAEERKQAQAAAAAERVRAAEERKQAQIEAKRIADENRKIAAEEAAAKRELQAQQRLQAQEEKNRQMEAQRAEREAREEQRKKNAAARAKEDFARYQMMVESDQKKLADDKAKLAKLFGKPKTPEVEEAPRPAQPRPTFSLFGVGGSSQDTTEKVAATTPAPAKKAPTAPRGVSTIDKWTLNSDNTISGFISGSPDFNDGSPVTTSPIAGKASSNTVVQTKSRSKYFLGEESSGGLFGGLFGGQQAPVSKPAPAEKTTDNAQAARKEAQAAAAAAKKAKQEEARQAAEARKQAQIEAVEARKRAQIEAAEAKKAAQEEARQAAAAKKQQQIEAAEAKKAKQEEARQAAEAKKQALLEAAEAKKAKQEEARQAAAARKQAQVEAAQAKKAAQEEARRAALAEKQRIAEEKKQAQLEAKKKAEEAKAARLAKSKQAAKPKVEAAPVAPVKGRPTVSLFGFGGGDEPDTSKPAAASAAPRGVPVISRWKQSPDGSISGVISGSSSFRDGSPVETSPIRGKAVGGKVVVTTSGSKYFLSGGNAPAAKASNNAKAAADALARSRLEAAEAKKAKQEEARQAAAARKQAQVEAARAKKAAQEEARKAALAEKQRIAEEKKQAQLEAKKKAEEAKAARLAKSKQAAKPKVEAAPVAPVKGRPTVSLFGFGGGDDKVAPAPAPQVTKKKPAAAKKQAPRGVPTINGWKLNGDGTISGTITGSPNFRDGERVTTSQIANGRIESGSVVKTGSGSQYFLG